jgi:hypothetical protein
MHDIHLHVFVQDSKARNESDVHPLLCCMLACLHACLLAHGACDELYLPHAQLALEYVMALLLVIVGTDV